jgi:exonuclease SbcC
MRINKLKFSNLNSLKGEFEIDFTDNNIIEDNIFAIIGNTGSGKSTILDAITLALFAKTARIEKITGSSNEIMNRDSSSCYSEVMFTTSNKEYSALFSQRKARNKKDGNLTMYKRELRNYSDNKIIATNKTFEAELMELINLTFDQFSRSVLLAQGDFNKFLIAKDDEKAKILEQITGTEIYSQIGMKIYSHYSEEKKKLDILDAQLQSQNILTEDEKKKIDEEILLNNDKIIEINKRKSQIEKEIAYYNFKANLNKKREQLATVIQDRDSQITRYNDYLNKIELNKKAQEPLELLNKITLDNEKISVLKQDIKNLNDELKVCELNITELHQEEDSLKSKLKENEEEKINLLSIIKQVRPLDKEINEKALNNFHQKDKIKDLNTSILVLKEELSSIQVKTQSLKDTIKTSEDYIASHINDKLLVDNFSNIVSNNNLLQTTLIQKTKIIKDLNTAEIDLQVQNKRKKQIDIDLDEINSAISALKKDNQIDFDKVELENKLDSLERTRSTLERASSNFTSYKEDTKLLDAKNEELLLNRNLYLSSKKQLDEITVLYEKAELAYNRGKELLKLSAFANTIKDNEPCPLCGSISHPHPIAVNENDLAQEKSNLSDLQKKLRNSTEKVNSLNSELQIIEARKIQLTISIEKNRSILINALNRKENFEKNFIKEVNENNNSIKELKKKIKDLENISLQITDFENSKTKLEERLDNSKYNISSLVDKIESFKKNISDANSTIDSIDNFFIPFELFKDKSNKELDLLKNTYTNHKNIIENKYIELDNIKTRSVKVESDIKANEALLKDSNDSMVKDDSILKQLTKKRCDIFGDKDCDDELNSINDIITSNTNKLTSIVEKISSEDKIHSIKLTKLKIAQDNEESLSKTLVDTNKSYSILLVKNNFTSNDALLLAKLDDSSIRKYESFIKEHEYLCERIKAIEEDIKKDEVSLNENKPIDSYEECISEKSSLDLQYDVLQQTKGNLQEKLDTNSKNIERISSIKDEREKQFIKSDNWSKLNTAVGSSDGKKFRGLAQGITLDYLLNNSNNKLSNLTDRYSLVRSTNSASTLDIDVIDLYMNGITRSVNNLSGGEKFLVSLSLALGLCELVNSDNPSETLFLDEGFGTLDEDTLDNALNTLMVLSEKENKLIGIISHVQKVKDAINHKIIVEKNGNGSSTITGPGVK